MSIIYDYFQINRIDPLLISSHKQSEIIVPKDKKNILSKAADLEVF